jgi:hypothetical protein
MDMALLQQDVKKALDLLPPEVVKGILSVIIPHQAALARTVPLVVPLIKPHLAAGGIEQAAGMLDLAEVAGAVVPVLMAYLQEHAAPATNAAT